MRTIRTTYALAAFGIGVLIFVGCHSNQAQAPIVNGSNYGDPDASMNLMQVPDDPQNTGQTYASAPNGATQVAGASYAAPQQANGEAYGDASDYADDAPDPYAEYVDGSVPEADTAPPDLPEYEQPEPPNPDYLWTPGYWDNSAAGYYWVPGAWVAPPYIGALWTPGWWGYYGHRYRFHHGYWGTNIGFYGGMNYGFGYLGVGYVGGYWNQNHFWYNRSYNRINNGWRYAYTRPAPRNQYFTNNRVGYYGGQGGIRRPPMRAELLARAQRVTPPMRQQMQVRTVAAQNRGQFYSTNRGRPASFAAARPLAADRGISRPAPIAPAVMQQHVTALRQQQQHLQVSRPNVQGGQRPGTPGNTMRPNETHPGQPGNVARPMQPGGGTAQRPGQQRPEQQRPGQPGNVQRPGQSGNFQRPQPGNVQQPGREQNQNRPQMQRPAPQNRPVQEQPRPQMQQPTAPVARPAPARPAQEQPRPQMQTRPVQQQPRPQAPRPSPQMQRPAPVARPAPAARPARPATPRPAARPAPAHEERR